MTNLRELEKRLETATESSWELDRDIGLLIGGWSYEPDDSEIVRKYPMRRWLRDRDGNVFSDHPGSVSGEAFTDSLDAAVALVERILPAWIWDVTSTGQAWVMHHETSEQHCADAKTPPVALCLALIRALIAKGDKVKPKGGDNISEIDNIKRDWHDQWMRASNLWVVHETPDGYFQIEHHSTDGVAPPTRYSTKRQAASRLLQLLSCGPVAPQTWPEEICIEHKRSEP